MMLEFGNTGLSKKITIVLLSCILFFLSLIVVYLSVTTNVRFLFIFLTALLIPFLFLVDVEKVILFLLFYYVLMGFIRRFFYLFNPYIKYDPTYVIPDIFILIYFVYLLITKKQTILRNIKENFGFKIFLLLFFIMVVQMFNPLQGGLIVGVGGGKFWLIPMLWVFFSMFLNQKGIKKILIAVFLLGFIAALYGIKQAFWGFSGFEKKWLYYTISINKFSALSVHSVIRPFSFFPSPHEYGTFLMLVVIIGFSLILFRSYRYQVFLILLVIFYAAVLLSSRGIFFFVFLGFLFMLNLVSKRKRFTFGMTLMVLILYVIVASSVDYRFTLSAIPVGIPRLYTHVISGILDPFAKTSTLWMRIYLIKNLPNTIAKYPLGVGIGATSLAGWKFGGLTALGEISLVSLIKGGSVLSGLLYIVLVILAIKNGIIKYNKSSKWIYVVITGIIFTYFLGGSLTLYSTTPVYWLLIGYILRKDEL